MNKKSYVTLKDYKDNFLNNPKCRLINPAKSEIGIASKHYLKKLMTILKGRVTYDNGEIRHQ